MKFIEPNISYLLLKIFIIAIAMIEKFNFWNKISISISIISVIINLNNHPIFKNLFLGGSSYEPYHYKNAS